MFYTMWPEIGYHRNCTKKTEFLTDRKITENTPRPAVNVV